MRHRPLSLVVALVLVLGLSLGGTIGCTDASQKKWIDGANAAQQAAADTYKAAVVQQTAADVACAHAFAPTTPIPQTPDAKDATCATLGRPLPYKSLSLEKAAAPVNATYDLVRKANTARVNANAKMGDPALVTDLLTQLASLVVEIVGDLSGAGVPVPQNVLTFVDSFKTSGGKP